MRGSVGVVLGASGDWACLTAMGLLWRPPGDCRRPKRGAYTRKALFREFYLFQGVLGGYRRRRRSRSGYARRRRLGRLRFGLAAIDVELLDLGARPQLVEDLRHRLARQFLADLVRQLLEGGRRRLAAILELDDVVAELGLDRGVGEFALLEGEGGVGELLHHVCLLEPAKIAAFGARCLVGRLFLGELVEGAAFLEVGDQRLGLVLGRDQDMAGVYLFLGWRRLQTFLIAL